MKRTLEQMKVGQWGKVLAVDGKRGLKRRLIDMGITPGTEIAVKGVAPMGDPLEISLRGYALSIRKGDAAGVLVEMGGRRPE